MSTFSTPNRHGYSVRFSPFNPDRLVVATSQYYGLTGGGTLFILDRKSDGNLIEFEHYEWSDGLFDVVWSEIDESILITASGDGGLQLWNLNSTTKKPMITFYEHKKEVYSLDWCKSQPLILSASWDCTIKLWEPTRQTSINTFTGHQQLVYNAMFSPFIRNCFASVSGDGLLKLWNPLSSNKSTTTFQVHDGEVLSCDWCKFNENLLITSGSDGLIRGWDIRSYKQPIYQLKGCEYAVRRIQFSPHLPNILASVSYDFTTRIWDYKYGCDAIEIIKHHSEFVYGLDWNLHKKGQLADCGWDSLVHVFTPNSLKTYI